VDLATVEMLAQIQAVAAAALHIKEQAGLHPDLVDQVSSSSVTHFN
jgi:hypothetical protein